MSGFGEASGNLLIKTDTEILNKLMATDSVTKDSVIALLKKANLDPSIADNMGFGFHARKHVGDFIHIGVFDGSWIALAKKLADTDIELYAELWDNYTGSYLIANNGKGDIVNFFYEEESDAMDQDDFDEDAYWANIEKQHKKWDALVPEELKQIFE